MTSRLSIRFRPRSIPPPIWLFTLLAISSASTGCSRTGLDLIAEDGPAPDASIPTTVDASSPDAAPLQPQACPVLPEIPTPTPAPLGRACTFAAAAWSTTPVLAAFVGQDLMGLTPQGTLTSLFHFGVSTQNPLGQSVVSRGDFLGALVASSTPGAQEGDFAVDLELVILRLDGTVLVHHRESAPLTSENGRGGAIGLTGNAAGTFVFSVVEGTFSRLWLALADGTLLDPVQGASLAAPSLSPYLVEPDAKGRVLAWSGAGAVWVDFCGGMETPAILLATLEGLPMGSAAAWGSQLFGVTTAGDLATEAYDGVTVLAHPPIAGGRSSFWYFVPPGFALFALPPLPSYPDTTGNLLIVDATTLADHPIAVAYPPGFSPTPAGSWLDGNTTASPAGLGVDSSGNMTMFLAAVSSAPELFRTSDGSDWNAVWIPLPFDPSDFTASPRDVEAGGTYLVSAADYGSSGEDAGASEWPYRIVRPASQIDVPMPGLPAQLSRDGACVASLAQRDELDITNATTGMTTKVPLPSPVDPTAWTSTWIPGDDAAIAVP